jgi:2-polyprenyl-6-hydroxyphenyl methylase/3-demethylubiquinone-9 3-methyltransferase
MIANVDAAELQKFSTLAETWWDPRGPMRPLHEMNPLRTSWIDRHVGLRGRRALDVGCGGGLLAEAMARQGAEVTGIDMAGKPLQVARLHAVEAGTAVRYLESTAEALVKTEPGRYDVVACMEVLEHVPEPAQTVAACAQLAAPGGWCFFSTINRNAKAFALAIVGAEYVLRLLPRGTHEYAKFIRPSELVRHARDAGLDIAELAGIRYDPFTRRAEICADTDVNYLLACRSPAP